LKQSLPLSFSNSSFAINFSSNSQAILDLISNFIDFPIETCHSKFKPIRVEIHEIPSPSTEQSHYFYLPGVEKNSQWSGGFASHVAHVTVDSKKRDSRATVFGFEDSMKEQLIYLGFMKPIKYVMARQGIYGVHASVCAKGETAILIHGPKNTGKSTFVYSLQEAGYGPLCDDDCFLEVSRQKCLLHPFQTKLGAKSALISRYPSVKANLVHNYLYGNKARATLRGSYIENRFHYPRKLILFPKFSDERKISFRKIIPSLAMSRFIDENPNLNGKKRTAQNLKPVTRVYSALLKSAECYQVVYNDDNIQQLPEMVDRLLR